LDGAGAFLYNAHCHKLRFHAFEKTQFVTALGIQAFADKTTWRSPIRQKTDFGTAVMTSKPK